MNNKLPLSVVISVHNEEKKIEGCLKSVAQLADEIIIIDNESTDNTAKIASNYTKKIFKQQNKPEEIDLQKNTGFDKASKTWILSLDADERVSAQLALEINNIILNSKNKKNGYWIPRDNIIFGKVIRHTGWYPDYVLRLFRKGTGKYEQKHVHEMIVVAGDTGYLENPLIHHNYDNISQFLQKTITIYAPNEANYMLSKGYRFNFLDAIRFPVNEFLSRYFAREGYKDGFHGFVLSVLMSFYHFIKFAYLWEASGFKDMESPGITKMLEVEVRKSYRDLSYWISNEKLKKATNPISKFRLRVKRKLKI